MDFSNRIIVIILCITFLNSCTLRNAEISPTLPQYPDILVESNDDSENNPQNNETSDNTSPDNSLDIDESEPEPPSDIPELICGIEIVEYIDPYRVSEYNNLTEDQQLAFVELCAALNDIIKNGPVADKTYSLPKSMEWLDYKVALNLLESNYGALSTLILRITTGNNYDENNGIRYCNSFFLRDILNSYLWEEYSKFIEIDSIANKILSTLEHDGTDYCKAHSIAKWIVDNVQYANNHEQRFLDKLNSVYTVLTINEATCGGYAAVFDFLCKKSGLEAITVANETHAWNMIHIDGKWYHIDLTWMDGPNSFYKYFMISDKTCANTGHSEWYYYWDQKNDIYISAPVALEDLYLHNN